MGSCSVRSTTCGCGMPAASRMVGPMSMQWVNWERGARAAGVLDPVRPGEDHPVAGAAQVGPDLLAPLERGVAGPGPGRRIVRRVGVSAPGVQAAVLVEQRGLLLGGKDDAVGEGHL